MIDDDDGLENVFRDDSVGLSISASTTLALKYFKNY